MGINIADSDIDFKFSGMEVIKNNGDITKISVGKRRDKNE